MSEIVENPYVGLEKTEKEVLVQKELKRGFSPISLKRYLVHSGESEQEADEILERAKNIVHIRQAFTQEEETRDASSDFIWGFLLLIGGIILTAVSDGYIFYGAIIYGIVRIVMGIVSMSKQ